MGEDQKSDGIRLNKYIAETGLVSRRHADRLIEEGMVVVNGRRVYELGIKIDPQFDKIMVEGKPLKKPTTKYYVLFNKPSGVLTTMDDPHGRPTVADYVAKVPARLFPVGRLDWDSEGLLLLTNDGEFANKVMHPKAEVTKTYLVKVDGHPEDRHLEKLRKGVTIVGGKVAAKHIEKIHKSGDKKSDKYDWLKIVITEGKNRQIRQMFAKVGFDVLKLQRVAIGRLRLGSLKSGAVAFLAGDSLDKVFKPDLPDEVKAMKSLKSKVAQQKVRKITKKDRYFKKLEKNQKAAQKSTTGSRGQ